MKKAECIWTRHAEYSSWSWTRHTVYELCMLNTPSKDEQDILHMNKACWILLLKMKKAYCIWTRHAEYSYCRHAEYSSWSWTRHTVYELCMLNTPSKDEQDILHMNKACWILLLKMKKVYCIGTRHAEYSYCRWTRPTAYEEGILNTRIEDEEAYRIWRRRAKYSLWRRRRHTAYEQDMLNIPVEDEQGILHMNKAYWKLLVKMNNSYCIWTRHIECLWWRWKWHNLYEQGLL